MGVFKKYCCEQMGMTLLDMVEPDNLSDVLFVVLSNCFKESSWKSKKHFNGKELEDGGFVVGIETPNGPFVHYYDNEYWDLCKCEELEVGKDWDWKALRDVDRLLSLESHTCNCKKESYSNSSEHGGCKYV